MSLTRKSRLGRDVYKRDNQLIVKRERTVLIAEFDDVEAAHSATLVLKSEGLDMADVRIRGANWLNMGDPEGPMSILHAATMGAMIGGTLASGGGFLAGVSSSHLVGPLENPIWHILAYMVGFFAVGSVLGGLLGAGYGSVALQVDTPEWVAPEYGEHLQSGACLLLVTGEGRTLDVAQTALEEIHPLTLGIKLPESEHVAPVTNRSFDSTRELVGV